MADKKRRALIKPGSTTTEDSQRLEILDLGSRLMYYVEKAKELISNFLYDVAQMYLMHLK